MPVTRLTAGFWHQCGLLNQDVFCHGGFLGFGEALGSGTTSDQKPPTAYVDVAAGYAHTCAITSDGHAFCWGNNMIGQLGIGTHSYVGSQVPVRVAK
jgi:hypothetical protein